MSWQFGYRTGLGFIGEEEDETIWKLDTKWEMDNPKIKENFTFTKV